MNDGFSRDMPIDGSDVAIAGAVMLLLAILMVGGRKLLGVGGRNSISLYHVRLFGYSAIGVVLLATIVALLSQSGFVCD